MISKSGRPIVLYDGVCGLCDRFVQFIIKRDKEAHVRFAAMQSDVGKEFLRKFGLPEGDISYIVVIEGEKSYIKSAGILEIIRYLPGAWGYLALLRFIPVSFSDLVYDFTARNRYKWFGKYEACVIPTESERKRFLS